MRVEALHRAFAQSALVHFQVVRAHMSAKVLMVHSVILAQCASESIGIDNYQLIGCNVAQVRLDTMFVQAIRMREDLRTTCAREWMRHCLVNGQVVVTSDWKFAVTTRETFSSALTRSLLFHNVHCPVCSGHMRVELSSGNEFERAFLTSVTMRKMRMVALSVGGGEASLAESANMRT